MQYVNILNSLPNPQILFIEIKMQNQIVFAKSHTQNNCTNSAYSGSVTQLEANRTEMAQKTKKTPQTANSQWIKSR